MKYNIKRGCIFHLILVCIPSILILSVKDRGWGGVLLNRQNLLNKIPHITLKRLFLCNHNIKMIQEKKVKLKIYVKHYYKRKPPIFILLLILFIIKKSFFKTYLNFVSIKFSGYFVNTSILFLIYSIVYLQER